MKRVFIMLAIVLGSAGLLFAQKSNQKEVKQLQSFLQQKSAKGDANYIRLGITDIKNPAMWKGVVWSDGRAISIDWCVACMDLVRTPGKKCPGRSQG